MLSMTLSVIPPATGLLLMYDKLSLIFFATVLGENPKEDWNRGPDRECCLLYSTVNSDSSLELNKMKSRLEGASSFEWKWLGIMENALTVIPYFLRRQEKRVKNQMQSSFE